jgi:RimJ/RimL family protein N-acetyltransferase
MSTAADPSSSTTPRLAGDPAPDPASFVRIRTTLPRRPLPANAARQPILTERLLLRPVTAEDLPAAHELRTQPEVMHWYVLIRAVYSPLRLSRESLCSRNWGSASESTPPDTP